MLISFYRGGGFSRRNWFCLLLASSSLHAFRNDGHLFFPVVHERFRILNALCVFSLGTQLFPERILPKRDEEYLQINFAYESHFSLLYIFHSGFINHSQSVSLLSATLIHTCCDVTPVAHPRPSSANVISYIGRIVTRGNCARGGGEEEDGGNYLDELV